MIIGITGITGSGKTTLLQLIEQAGGVVLDCDAIYHQLLQEDAALLAAIEKRFPGSVCHGVLDRKALGQTVFSDPAALENLNKITHSAVRQKVISLLPPPPALAAIDAIGLFEGDLASLCDVTVAVTAPEEDRINRLMARDGIDRAYAQKRIHAQKSDDWYREKCSHTLENNSTAQQFRHKCLAFLQGLGIMDV